MCLVIKQHVSLRTAWIEDERVLQYSILAMSSDIMQLWREHVFAMLDTWLSNKPIRLLYDLTAPNMSMSYFVLSHRDLHNAGITADGKVAFLDFLKHNHDKDIKLAVLLSEKMMGVLSQYVPEPYEQLNYGVKIFFNADDAKQWLTVDVASEVNRTTNQYNKDEIRKAIAESERNTFDMYGDTHYLRLLVNGSLEVIPFGESQSVIIGRSAGADLSLGVFGEVAKSTSRQHMQISLEDGKLTVLDLNSMNGTYVDGQKIEVGEAVLIGRKTSIRVGGIEMQVVF